MNQNELKKLVEYNLETGIFTSLSSRGNIKKGSSIGNINSKGYLKTKLNGKYYLLHRLAFIYIQGLMPEQVDHINHNRTDNRWDNLRGVSNQENSMNMSMKVNNKSGVTGVFVEKRSGKWKAKATIDGKIYESLHSSFEDAIQARKSLKTKHGFHANHS